MWLRPSRAVQTVSWFLSRLTYSTIRPHDVSEMRWRGMLGWYQTRILNDEELIL
jgi:hypothetical protein